MRNFVVTFGLAIGATLIASAAMADEYHDQCVARGRTSVDFSECGSSWVGREESRLMQAWKRTYGALSLPSAKARLLAEQRKWIAYKDSSCALYGAAEEFGSIGWSIALPNCRARVIRDRTDQLNEYRTFKGR